MKTVIRYLWRKTGKIEPLYQNEVKCSAFEMQMIFHSHVNKTHFLKNGCELGLNLKVRVFGTRKWPIRLELAEKGGGVRSWTGGRCVLQDKLLKTIGYRA